MDIVRSVAEMQKTAKEWKRSGKSVGFVPTMGFLHEGHESLMQQARSKHDLVVVSIFVNPLQFGPNEDFERYPRDEAHDRLVAERNQVDLLFIPTVEEMYPTHQSIDMQVTQRVNVLCGRTREGHFSGVVTVLTKLFHICLPDTVYFGLKDAQQVAVVDALINDLNFPVELQPVATVREDDGLAKSSRNVYLSEQERTEAPYIYKALQDAKKMVVDGEKNPVIIVREVEQFINKHTNGKIDYVELLSYPDLTTMKVINQQVILATVVQFKHARLIDNIIIPLA
ncbi:pantoate--beta-alanine ligase [Aquibacillus koreensis]|uniref:Pantothenate synthetase n=1 Tax=Aquibacillus koreensis TaxID=279446 RepID=A0A9X3WI34_9BACI|nr:pantoate--beta-alanine ligase [Aquibacillus koreensis]MCT2537360.1 pantoate--beta-alanine ligase [Aquibacillus koreensis]MDC3418806.1 pantoate--beta-alanine ligase [Aquibacillus koreensis]